MSAKQPWNGVRPPCIPARLAIGCVDHQRISPAKVANIIQTNSELYIKYTRWVHCFIKRGSLLHVTLWIPDDGKSILMDNIHQWISFTNEYQLGTILHERKQSTKRHRNTSVPRSRNVTIPSYNSLFWTAMVKSANGACFDRASVVQAYNNI